MPLSTAFQRVSATRQKIVWGDQVRKLSRGHLALRDLVNGSRRFQAAFVASQVVTLMKLCETL